MILDGVCYPAIPFCRVILPRMEYPLVISLYLTSTVLSVEYLRLRESIDAPVFPLQCSVVNDTLFTLLLSRLLTFPLGRVH